MMNFAALFLGATLTAGQIDSIIGNAEKTFRFYAFPQTAARAVAMLKENTPRYEKLSDPNTFKAAVDKDLYAATHDKHIHLFYPFEGSDDNRPPSAAEIRAQHLSELQDNFGFESVRRLPGNIGYIDFRYFSDDPSVGQTIAAAMGFLANTDALIIDLRKNGGGSPIAAQTLEAYFFPHQEPITSIKRRDENTGVVTEHQQYTAATVPGPLYLEKPLYLLTSSRTFSCAEQFTYDLHNLHRVTVIGETTGGGANPGGVHALGNGFGIFMPHGYAYSPVTKTNWEGAGIAPDVAVSAPQALTKAYNTALKYALAHQHDADAREETQQALNDEAKALAGQP